MQGWVIRISSYLNGILGGKARIPFQCRWAASGIANMVWPFPDTLQAIGTSTYDKITGLRERCVYRTNIGVGKASHTHRGISPSSPCRTIHSPLGDTPTLLPHCSIIFVHHSHIFIPPSSPTIYSLFECTAFHLSVVLFLDVICKPPCGAVAATARGACNKLVRSTGRQQGGRGDEVMVALITERKANDIPQYQITVRTAAVERRAYSEGIVG